jgi:hypothetical protein
MATPSSENARCRKVPMSDKLVLLAAEKKSYMSSPYNRLQMSFSCGNKVIWNADRSL